MRHKLKVAKYAFNKFADISEVLQPSPSTNMSSHSNFTIAVFTLLAPYLRFIGTGYALAANPGMKHYNETAGGAAVLGMINLCMLCKQFAFLSMTDVCIPMFPFLSVTNACIPKRDAFLSVMHS